MLSKNKLMQLYYAGNEVLEAAKDTDIKFKDDHIRRIERSLSSLETVIRAPDPKQTPDPVKVFAGSAEIKGELERYQEHRLDIINKNHVEELFKSCDGFGESYENEHAFNMNDKRKQHVLLRDLSRKEFFRMDFEKPFNDLSKQLSYNKSVENGDLQVKISEVKNLALEAFPNRPGRNTESLGR